MAHRWTPDVALGAESAHEIVSEAFPYFRDARPRELGRGWNNFCIIYPDATVFRLPTRVISSSSVLSEISVLPRIREVLPVPVPDLKWTSGPVADYPFWFVGYPLLEGETADRANLTPDKRTAMVPAVAGFLRALHSVGDSCGTHEEGLSRIEPEALLQKIERRATELGSGVIPIAPDRLISWAREIGSQTHPQGDKVLVHGDFYARHLLVQDGALRGVIDWGTVCRGPSAGDLSIAFTFVPSAERERFFDLYDRPVTDETRNAAQLRAAAYGLSFTAYGLGVGDAELLALGHEILRDLPLA